MPRPFNAVLAATAGLGALLAAGCLTYPQGGPGPQAGMLEQMRAHHRCVEGEMARRADGGRSMPGKEQMAAMMQHCPMPAGMREAMMPMMMRGGMQPGSDASSPDHPQSGAPPAEH